MRSWLLMTVVSLGALAGVSSEGQAYDSGTYELNCRRCTGLVATELVGNGATLRYPASIQDCLRCPESDKEPFVEALNGFVVANPTSERAGAICDIVNTLIQDGIPIQQYLVTTCNTNAAVVKAEAGSEARGDAITAANTTYLDTLKQ